jgi:DNA-binding transcriptional LysR family regulator
MSRKQFLDGLHAVVHSEGQPEGAFEALLRQQGLTRRVVLRLKHYLAIPAILRESNLIFTVPYAIGTSLAEFANIKLLKPPIAPPRADIKQYWHARFHHDPANQWIRGVVAELFLEQRRRAQRGSAGG